MSLFSIIVIKDRQKIIERLKLLVVALKVSSYKYMSMQARASYHLCKKDESNLPSNSVRSGYTPLRAPRSLFSSTNGNRATP